MDYRAFHKLSYGLYIIASEYEGKKAGYIGNTVFQVTSKPPRIAISCHKDNETAGIILQSKCFSVSVLKQQASTSLIGEFGFMSSSEIDKFSRVKVEKYVTGAPVVLDSSLAWVDCRVIGTMDTGSHFLIIGEAVASAVIEEGEPLTYAYYRDKYKMLAPKNAPTYIEKELLERREETPGPVREEPESGPSGEAESHVCLICGYVYRQEEGDLSAGIQPGTPFGDLPEDYRCPICNAGKEYFKPLE